MASGKQADLNLSIFCYLNFLFNNEEERTHHRLDHFYFWEVIILLVKFRNVSEIKRFVIILRNNKGNVKNT